MARLPPPEPTRAVAFLAIGGVLGAAIWWQRDTIGAAVGEMAAMSGIVVAVLFATAALERLARADILRRLLGSASFGRALTIHDVGSAASKGIPLGGPIATGLRWSIARDAEVPTTRLASALVGYGAATTFVTWMLPFGVLLLEITRRRPTETDLVMLAVCAAVLGASAAFWAVVLRSQRVTEGIARLVRRVWVRAARAVPAVRDSDPAAGWLEIRDSLRTVARRPLGLLARTAVAQSCGAVILLIALRSLGVGAELGPLEFARVYFVVTLLSSFVPVPGGIGVVEAGLTGALVAAGADPTAALAAVLVYRLLTYVAPMVVGVALYTWWRLDVRHRRRRRASTLTPRPVS